MSATNPDQIIELIEEAVNELRPQLGLGPITRAADGPAIAVPLFAASDPVHPTLIAYVSDGNVYLIVEWIAPMHNFKGLENLLIRFRRGRVNRTQIGYLILAFAAALASNRVDGTSWVGLDDNTGNIFVKDSFPAADLESVMLRERLKCIIEHARGLRNSIVELWSDGLELPDLPESPYGNCFPIP